VNWQEFRKMYTDLDKQFAVPKRHWWERIPYLIGWWWRVPYAWLLKLRPVKRVISGFGPAAPGTSKLIQNIDIYGPESRPFCGYCIDPDNCPEQGGCCFPPFKVEEKP